MRPRQRHPIVVVGNGVAGLCVALAAAPAPVRLLYRSLDGGGTASALAQGGVAAALAPDDSVRDHARDTLAAGAGHNDPGLVRWLTGQAPQAIAWLQRQGVGFDSAPDGSLLLAREGGHSAPRVVHAGGDATGAALVQALRARVARSPHVQCRGGVEVHGLVRQGSAVTGVCMRDARGREHVLEASAVVLATGGIGALFARTTNPPGADGAGLALGLAAGAKPRDLEFVQFHPTALDVPGHGLPLLTEALRGAGARLLDADLRPLMEGVHPLGDLAPRDVVARQVWLQLQAQGRVWLDGTTLRADWARHFPTVLAACLAHGLDPRRGPLPVTPAAHFHMGGLACDADGRTSLPGLFAVGEVACNGLHGANRLASNSLLEGVLCGQRLGRSLAGTAGLAAGAGTRRRVMLGAVWRRTRLKPCGSACGGRPGHGANRRPWQRRAPTAWPPAGRAGKPRLAAALLQAAALRRTSLGAHHWQPRTEHA